MKPVVLLPLICLVLGGCLVQESTCTFDKRGKGELEATYTLDYEATRALNEALFAQPPGYVEPEPFPPPRPFDVHWFKAHAHRVKGFTLTSATQSGSRTSTVTRVKGRFTSLEAAMRAQVFVGTRTRLIYHRATSKREARWELRFDERLFDLDANLEGANRKRFLAPLRTLLEGLTIRRTITLPTEILEANGKIAKNKRTVTWERKGKAVVGKDAAMRVIFANTEDLELEPFDYDPFRKDKALLIRRLTNEVPPPPPPPTWPGGPKAPQPASQGEQPVRVADPKEGQAPPKDKEKDKDKDKNEDRAQAPDANR